MYSSEGHYRPYSSQKSRDRRQRRPPEPVSVRLKIPRLIFLCREKEDRVPLSPYRSPLAEQRLLVVKAATGGHCRATGIVVASGHQEVRGTEEQGHWEVKEREECGLQEANEMEGRGPQEVREKDEEVLAVRER